MKTLYKKLLFLMLILPLGALAQSTLGGVVTDASSGQPLPGVNVIVQGGSNATSTDFDGKYQLTGLKKGDVVVYSYVGYQDSTVAFNGQATANVSLSEAANQLQEVVVQVGYGSVKKKDATGSVTVLGVKDFNKGANVTVENLISGRAPGVTINTSGAPGSGSTIRIRGGSSLSASNDPLVVIDGMPIMNQSNVGSTSALGFVNPNDIESVTVLKDASATAIYGSRASNGVIIITTKKGSKKLSAEYNFTYGSGSLIKKIDVFDAAEFATIVNEHASDLASGLGTANTDWQDAIYRRTDYVDNNLSVRGDLFNRIPTRLTFGNTYQEGLRLTNAYTRNNVSLAMNPSFFTDHLKFNISANYTNERSRFADDVSGAALRFDPTQPVYDPNSIYGGFFQYYNESSGSLDQLAPKNPVAQLLQTNDSGRNNRLFGNIQMDYKFHFFPDMRLVVNAGFDEQKGKRVRIVGVDAGSSPSNNGIPYGDHTNSEQTFRNKLLDSYLNYTHTFGKFSADVTAGYSYQKWEGYGSTTNNPNAPGYLGGRVYAATPIVTIGFFGRANLSWNDKYLLTVSMRRDGTSRFSEDNRWGNFPAAAFAWKMREDFFKDSKSITDLKLRLGAGVTGQQELGNGTGGADIFSIYSHYYSQLYQTGQATSQYYFGDTAYPIVVSQPFNTKLKWETATTYNVGIDLGLYNRVNATFDVFYRKTSDLFALAPYADGTNFSNFGPQNVGSFTTRGGELGITGDVIKNEKATWTLSFNVSKYERRIDELALNADVQFGDSGAGTGNLVQILREGYTPGSFYVYKQLYDQAGQPIEGAFADLNGDGVINSSDRYIYKNGDPDATFGFASTLNWGHLDFAFNVRASYGNRLFDAIDAGNAQYNNLQSGTAIGNIPREVLVTNFNTTSSVVLSDLYVQNASWLKLDNVTLGYTFNKWIEADSTLRLFVGAKNVFTWTKYQGIDPEVDGIDKSVYPRQRTILFGANIKF